MPKAKKEKKVIQKIKSKPTLKLAHKIPENKIAKPLEEEKIIEIDIEEKIIDPEIIIGEETSEDEDDDAGLDEEEIDPFKDKWEE